MNVLYLLWTPTMVACSCIYHEFPQLAIVTSCLVLSTAAFVVLTYIILCCNSCFPFCVYIQVHQAYREKAEAGRRGVLFILFRAVITCCRVISPLGYLECRSLLSHNQNLGVAGLDNNLHLVHQSLILLVEQ